MLEQILAQIYANKQIQLDPFNYVIGPFAFTAAGVLTGNINIQADSDFILMTTEYWVDVAAAAQTAATRSLFNGTVLLTDTGSGRQLMSQAVPVDNIFGNGQFPYVWQQPKMFASKSTLQVQVTQIEATTQNLYLTFSGVKVFVLG